MFYKIYIVYRIVYIFVAIASPSLVALHPLVSETAKCIVYCCFTRTTLFTTMFTVIIVVCSLKSMCVPRFILIGYCVSELHGHICPYHKVWPEAVYCCFARTTIVYRIVYMFV